MDNNKDNINLSKIIDEMTPFEFRLNKTQNFSAYTLPRTKFNELYSLIKQENSEKDEIHYYIVDNGEKVIGRFDIGYDLEDETAGITYHLIEQFQNRGIGQTALKSIVDDIFNGLPVGRIIILPINDRSVAIAVKSGFQKRTERVFQLNRERWMELQTDMNKGENEGR